MNDAVDPDDLSDIDELMWAASDLPPGPLKIAMVEDAVRRAEMRADDDYAQEIREELITASTFGGRPDVALVTFSRYLAYADAHPDETDEHGLLWKYKWIIGNLPVIPEITRPQIDASLQDFERRSDLGGYSRYAALRLRWSAELDMGRFADAKSAYKEFEAANQDSLGDCKACVEDDRVRYFTLMGDPEQAVATAQPMLKKRLTCAEIPHRTLARVLEPMRQLDDLESALDCHLRGYKMIKGNPEFVDRIGEHLSFLGLTANTKLAFKVLEKSLPIGLTAVAGPRFDFLVGALTVLNGNLPDAPSIIRTLLPETHPLHRADCKYPTAELQAALLSEAQELATQFDQRNGNSWFQERLSGATRKS